MKDFRDNSELVSGALTLLSGDFSQALTIILRLTTTDDINICLKSSYLWRFVKTLKLANNWEW